MAMRGYNLFLLILLAALLHPFRLGAQQAELSPGRQEVEIQVRQDQALKQAKGLLEGSSFKGNVRKWMKYGHAAFSQEQYAIALDRYLRAFEREKDSANRVAITCLLGQCQQRLNHAKAASQHYRVVWKSGYRDPEFLQDYVDVLFSLGDYDRASLVIGEMEKQGGRTALLESRKRSLAAMPGAEEMQKAFGLVPGDLVYDTLLNTAFSEYGPSLVMGQLYFSSSRPEDGQHLSDPRTGQGYSRLFSARYDTARKRWVDPRPVQGEVAGLKGNVGTFSYDSTRNLGFFTWSQGTSTGIYTVQRQPDGSWANLQPFLFNYRSGSDDFVGKVAHPSVSKDGRRLLFAYHDPSRGGSTDLWYVERVERKPEPEKKRRRPSSRSRRNQSTIGQAVSVNADWGVPVRLPDAVNTPGREAFPQWVNDSMFVFASDGHAGNGGMDLYLAQVDKENPAQVEAVSIFPRPVNSSYDDNALLPDPAHGSMILSSNRYTSWGRTDNLYHVAKFGLKHGVKGRVYTLARPEEGADSSALAAFVPEEFPVTDYYVMATNEASGFYQSVRGDSSGCYAFSYLEPGTYEFTVYADGYQSSTRTVSLEKDRIMLPVLVWQVLDFPVTAVPARVQPAEEVLPEEPVSRGGAVYPLAEVSGTSAEEDLSPREIINRLDSVDRFVSALDQRYVSDYKKRVNDPLRRARLTVVPPTAKCDVCGEKSQWRKNVGEEFFVKSGDDKALISLIDDKGRTTYIDLAPNAAYSIQVQTVGREGPKLPTGIEESDIVRKVVSRDYILFECMPKLSEINDEVYVNNVYFDFDKAELVKDGPRELDRMIIVAIKNPQMYFQIESHADERGSEEYNRHLTDRRLAAIEDYVAAKGMDMDRVVGRSMGESDPLIANARTEEEHRLNRRTTFSLVNPHAVNVKRGDTTYPAPEVPPLQTDQVRFMVQVGAFHQPIEAPLEYYGDILSRNPDLKLSYYMDQDGLYKYNVGGYFSEIEQARAVVARLLEQKRECYISAFYKGRRITVSEALQVIRSQEDGDRH